MTTIRPLFDRVLVQRNDEPTQTKSGLFLPDTANKEKPVQGTILAVGNGRVADDGEVTPLTVKVGDTVKLAVMLAVGEKLGVGVAVRLKV